LVNLLAGFQIVDLLRILARGIAHDVRAFAQSAAHGVVAEPVRKQAQLSLDLVEPPDINLDIHYCTYLRHRSHSTWLSIAPLPAPNRVLAITVDRLNLTSIACSDTARAAAEGLTSSAGS